MDIIDVIFVIILYILLTVIPIGIISCQNENKARREHEIKMYQMEHNNHYVETMPSVIEK